MRFPIRQTPEGLGGCTTVDAVAGIDRACRSSNQGGATRQQVWVYRLRDILHRRMYLPRLDTLHSVACPSTALLAPDYFPREVEER